MAYLENEKIVHRQLMAQVVLVGENNTVKIAGFQIAKVLENDKYQAEQGEFLVQ